MKARSMIIVAAGFSERFGRDKLMTEVGGGVLIKHTVSAVGKLVDECIVVVRRDQLDAVTRLDMAAKVVAGGSSRTRSEMAGVSAAPASALIGIHDGARPIPDPTMVETLFRRAEEFGGAVPGLAPRRTLISRGDLAPIRGVVRVQTPQVFWGPELKAAFLAAERAGFDGHDTADVVRRFTNLEIVMVEGDPGNVKVTYPADLDALRDRLR